MFHTEGLAERCVEAMHVREGTGGSDGKDNLCPESAAGGQVWLVGWWHRSWELQPGLGGSVVWGRGQLQVELGQVVGTPYSPSL